ncbi:aspartate/glutamate racemase family protein [Arenibacterium sp. LLYu02]|uniref:aspartate/glutamate racemase family protein n=1 Tax=Arenibacterium sp. LLYu02 TaxID=3404132 RepID=UPI003B21D525
MILLINPNATEAMTADMTRVAQDQAGAIRVEGWTSLDGPPAIQGVEDGEAAVPPLLKLIEKAAPLKPRAILIGCFDDTGLAEAQALAPCPVFGIGQAAYHLAAMIGGRFSVVTTLDVSVPILRDNVLAYGLGGALAKVRASGVPVLALEQAEARVADEIRLAIAEDGVTSVVLGCGGMAALRDRLQAETPVRLIDGVRAAVAMACGLPA